MLIFVGFLFFIIGFSVLVSGIFSVFKVRRALAASQKTSGKVIGFGQISGKSGYLYCPQISFQTRNGQIFNFQSELGTQPPAYKVGQNVPVVYQISDPNKAEIDSATALWFVPGCTILVALLFSGLGFTLFCVGVFVEIPK